MSHSKTATTIVSTLHKMAREIPDGVSPPLQPDDLSASSAPSDAFDL
ncbi:MAG: hypothetical protein QOD99_445, partial [Chthoniobacter sp.]|nr:hypothetical protein [Chthoniobacter sp.]